MDIHSPLTFFQRTHCCLKFCWKLCAVFLKAGAHFSSLLETCLNVVGNFCALVLHWPHQSTFQQKWFHAGIYIYQLEPDLLETPFCRPVLG